MIFKITLSTRNKFAVLIGMAWTLLVSACSSNKESIPITQEKFPVTHPLVIDTVYAKEYVAQIQSIQNVELRSRVKGFIQKIHVDEGQLVKAGEVLFTLSSQEFQEELTKAESQVKSAKAELKVATVEAENAKILVSKNIISPSELEMAQAKAEAIRAKIAEAQSSISSARINLSFTQVKAPFSGIINRIPNKVGSLIEEGIFLTSISNNQEVFAYFNVSEKEYLDNLNTLSKGNAVTLLLANNQPHKAKGIIETVESEIDQNTGNIAFRARFPNPGQLLKHGSSGKISLNTRLSQALVVPQKSTFEIQDKTYVYLVDEKNTVHMKSIVPSLRLADLYVIEAGLSSRDKILYEGIQRVKEGDTIIPELIGKGQSNFLELARK